MSIYRCHNLKSNRTEHEDHRFLYPPTEEYEEGRPKQDVLDAELYGESFDLRQFSSSCPFGSYLRLVIPTRLFVQEHDGMQKIPDGRNTASGERGERENH